MQAAVGGGSSERAWIGSWAHTHGRVRGPAGAEVPVGGQGGLRALGGEFFRHGCGGDGIQEGLVGGVGHATIRVAVQWEARGGELHPGVAHLQKVVRGESVVAARFGHLQTLKRVREEETQERSG